MPAHETLAHTRQDPAALARRRFLLIAAAPAALLLGACGQQASGVCTPAAELDPAETAPGREGPEPASENGDPFVPSEDARLSELGLALSPDGSLLAAGEWWERRMLGLTETSGTTLWDTATGQITARLDDNQVMVWDQRTDEREDLPRAPGSVGRLQWSPEGDILYGASRSQGVIAWDGTDWTTFEQP